MLLVDPELLQDAMTDRPEHRLDGRVGAVGQWDGAAGPSVVAAGGSHAVNDRLEDLAGVPAELARP